MMLMTMCTGLGGLEEQERAALQLRSLTRITLIWQGLLLNLCKNLIRKYLHGSHAMQLALLLVVEGGTEGLEVEAALVAVTSVMTLPHLAREVLGVVVTTTVKSAVVVMVVRLHMVVVAMVGLGLPVPGIKVIVAPY
jgi:hypothetical protein